MVSFKESYMRCYIVNLSKNVYGLFGYVYREIDEDYTYSSRGDYVPRLYNGTIKEIPYKELQDDIYFLDSHRNTGTDEFSIICLLLFDITYHHDKWFSSVRDREAIDQFGWNNKIPILLLTEYFDDISYRYMQYVNQFDTNPADTEEEAINNLLKYVVDSLKLKAKYLKRFAEYIDKSLLIKNNTQIN